MPPPVVAPRRPLRMALLVVGLLLLAALSALVTWCVLGERALRRQLAEVDARIELAKQQGEWEPDRDTCSVASAVVSIARRLGIPLEGEYQMANWGGSGRGTGELDAAHERVRAGLESFVSREGVTEEDIHAGWPPEVLDHLQTREALIHEVVTHVLHGTGPATWKSDDSQADLELFDAFRAMLDLNIVLLADAELHARAGDFAAATELHRTSRRLSLDLVHHPTQGAVLAACQLRRMQARVMRRLPIVEDPGDCAVPLETWRACLRQAEFVSHLPQRQTLGMSQVSTQNVWHAPGGSGPKLADRLAARIKSYTAPAFAALMVEGSLTDLDAWSLAAPCRRDVDGKPATSTTPRVPPAYTSLLGRGLWWRSVLVDMTVADEDLTRLTLECRMGMAESCGADEVSRAAMIASMTCPDAWEVGQDPELGLVLRVRADPTWTAWAGPLPRARLPLAAAPP